MSETMPTLGAPIRSIRAVIPAFNEESNLAELVQTTLEALHDVTPTYDVVIVNDGSTDGTRRIAEACVAAHPNVHVVHHARRRGPGAAWRSGVEGSVSQFTLFVDADRQYDPLELERIAQWGDAYDLMAGFRFKRADGMRRRALGLLFRLTTRVYLRVRARDVSCGFLLIRTSLLQRLLLESDGVVVHPELRLRAHQLGARTREVGVHHFARRRGKSTGARPRTILKAVRELSALKKRLSADGRRRASEEHHAARGSDDLRDSTLQDPGDVVEPPVAGAT